MGAGPALLMACRKAGVSLERYDLSSLRQLCAAGSPLPAEGYDWVYEQLHPELLLNVGSGGTDVCTRHRPGRSAPAGLPRRDRRLPARGRRRELSTPTGGRSSGSSASS